MHSTSTYHLIRTRIDFGPQLACAPPSGMSGHRSIVLAVANKAVASKPVGRIRRYSTKPVEILTLYRKVMLDETNIFRPIDLSFPFLTLLILTNSIRIA